MNLFHSYEMQYKLFRWTGMAKNDFESRTQRILYTIYDVFLTVSYTFFDLTYAQQLMAVADDEPFEAVLLNSVCFLICLGILGKRLFVLGNKQKVKDLYLRTKNDFDNPLMKNVKEGEFIIKKFDRMFRINTNILYFMGICTSVLFSMPSYLNFPNSLPFPLPFQRHLSPTMIFIVLVWQTLLIWIGYINFLAYDSLVWGFLMLISARMEMIAKMWDQFYENYPVIDFKKYIPEYVGYSTRAIRNRKMKYRSYDVLMRHDERIVEDTRHFLKVNIIFYQEIIEEVAIVEKVFSFPLIIHMFGGAALIGIIIVFVITGGFNTWYGYRSLSFFLCTIHNLFIFSYYGTKILKSRDSLCAAVYGSNWYDGDVSTAKLFMYYMSMMRNKMQYSAGGFFPINLESYLSLMKISYNLLAVLK